MGTSPEAIDLAEDRDRFRAVLRRARHRLPRSGRGIDPTKRRDGVAEHIGFPLLVRPSYVLGGRGMAIVYDDDQLDKLHG